MVPVQVRHEMRWVNWDGSRGDWFEPPSDLAFAMPQPAEYRTVVRMMGGTDSVLTMTPWVPPGPEDEPDPWPKGQRRPLP